MAETVRLTDDERAKVLAARVHGGFRCDDHLVFVVERVVAAHVDAAVATLIESDRLLAASRPADADAEEGS